MELILKIAWRNVLRHKGKSLMIGVILFLGAFLMTLGNGLVSGMDRGLRDNIINTFLGHLVILSAEQKSDNVLFELYGKTVAPINNFPDIKKALAADPSIDKFLPVGKNMALSLREDSDPDGFFLLGVDIKEYLRMFPGSFTVTEGRVLNEHERGVLIPEFTRKETFNITSLWLLPEDGQMIEANLSPQAKESIQDLKIMRDQVFLGSNEDNSTTDVRVGIKGIIRYKALNSFWGNFIIIDIESYRESMGYFSAAQKAQTISKDKQALLAAGQENLDDMFSTDALIEENKNAGLAPISFEKRTIIEPPADLESGTYNMIFVKLKDGDDLNRKASSLEQRLKDRGLGVRVVTWEKASGMIGSLAVVMKGVLYGFVAFLFLVAIIIIVNTLSMAALERVSEIGMMRAVGAQKNFIGAVFLGETGILSAIFGLAGIAAGAVVVFVLPLFKITTDNDMIQLFYGGTTLSPVLSGGDILITVVELILVALIAVVYPMRIAQTISPLDAVTRD